MRSLLLGIGILTALINCGAPHNALYVVSSVSLFIWFYARGMIDEPTPGEQLLSLIAIVGSVAGLSLMIYQHTDAGAFAFMVVITIIIVGVTHAKR